MFSHIQGAQSHQRQEKAKQESHEWRKPATPVGIDHNKLLFTGGLLWQYHKVLLPKPLIPLNPRSAASVTGKMHWRDLHFADKEGDFR